MDPQSNGSSSSGGGQNFLDRGTVIALVIVGALWVGWSKWVEIKYPQQPAKATEIKAAAKSADASVGNAVTTSPSGSPAVTSAPTSKSSSTVVGGGTVKTTPIETDGFKATLSGRGMALSDLEIKGYRTRDDQPIVIGRQSTSNEPALFATSLVGESEPLVFDIESKDDSKDEKTWTGTADRGAFKIKKTMSLIQDGLAKGRGFKVVVEAAGDLSSFPGFRTSLADEIKSPGSSSFLTPSYDHNDWYVKYDDTKARAILDPAKPAALDHKNVFAIALSTHYFTSALADRSNLRPDFKSEAPSKVAGSAEDKFITRGFLDYVPTTKGSAFAIEQTLYLGPKDVDHLRSADEQLSHVVDYGMFAIIAEPLLWLLRFFYSIFHNWGFAIIGLTLVVRALVMPFNLYSFKSMKVMQKIQPQMTAVKERYKDDPRRMNEEVMKLMKENKANPLGGCLPMLLQLPVFFALYQVLAQSIELYRAPFIFWIHDLSVKDPYYVLPILMGVSMFLNQKVTPVADPQQAKILQWMPVLFSFLMISLPSGLTLYIFVSTIFGIAQQLIFMRDRSATAASNKVREAKA